MIENFKTDLLLRTAQLSTDEILKRMGYQRHQRKGTILRARLKNVLASEFCGLEEGGFDFHYSSPEFLRALCRVLDMDPAITEPRIIAMQNYLEDERSAFKPYIWIDTGFKRASQNLFALAAMEHRRYLGFPKGFWRNLPSQQLGTAQRLVREHMTHSKGNLSIWGRIQRYFFYYTVGNAYILGLDGAIICKHIGPISNGPVPNREMAVITSGCR